MTDHHANAKGGDPDVADSYPSLNLSFRADCPPEMTDDLDDLADCLDLIRLVGTEYEMDFREFLDAGMIGRTVGDDWRVLVDRIRRKFRRHRALN